MEANEGCEDEKNARNIAGDSQWVRKGRPSWSGDMIVHTDRGIFVSGWNYSVIT